MTNQEVESLIDIPISKLAPICSDPKNLALVIGYAIQIGIRLGHRQSHEATNKALSKYRGELIKN